MLQPFHSFILDPIKREVLGALSSPPMNKPLPLRIYPDIERALNAILPKVENLSEEVFLRRTPPTWSIGHVVMHLTLAAESGNGGFQKRIAKYAAKHSDFKARRTWTQRFLKSLVFTLGSIPFRAKAPEMVRPQENLDRISKREILKRYESAVKNTVELASSMPVGGHPHIFIPHFVFGDLTLAEWAQFMRIHAEHHSKQIDRLLR